MADNNILRKYVDCCPRQESSDTGPNEHSRVKCCSQIESRSPANFFRKLFPGSKFSSKFRSRSSDRNKKSSNQPSNSATLNRLPPKSMTMDPIPLSQSTIRKNDTQILPIFDNLSEQSDIPRTIFKWDILEEHMMIIIDKYPFLFEMHKFLCSEKYHVLEMIRRCTACSDLLRTFASLTPLDRSRLFQDFELICEKLVGRCDQVKIAFDDLRSPQDCSDTYKCLSIMGHLFNNQLCADLNWYSERLRNIEKLHARIVKNGCYHHHHYNHHHNDINSTVQDTNETLIDCLTLPLQRSSVYAEVLKNLLLLAGDQRPHYSITTVATTTTTTTSSSFSYSTSSLPSRRPSATSAAVLKIKGSLLDVLRSLAEMSASTGMSLDDLQRLFPRDDLMLGIAVQHVPQRSTLPEPIKRYKLTKKKKPVYNSSVPSFSQVQFSPDRTVIIHSSVQLHKNLSTFNLFLLTDLLILAKGSMVDKTLELKERIEVSQMWIKDTSEDKNSSQSTANKSLLIGWPLVNMIVTFDTVSLKQRWMEALTKQIEAGKAREVVKQLVIKVEARMTDTIMCKMIQVKSDETSHDVVLRLLKELRVDESREAQDFQLCVMQESEESAAFELSGHEFPFCIQLQELRQQNRDPQDRMAIIEKRPLFLLRDKKKSRPISEENMRASATKPKRKKLKNIFRKSKHSTPSKFFGQNLSAIFIDGYPPQNLKLMLEKLFEIGPYCNGIFRKSANHAKLKQITGQLDSGLDVDFSDVPVIMIANIMKKFLRSLPDCLLMSHLYHQWLEVAKEVDDDVIVAICKKQYGRLLPFNQSVLLDLMCILRRIDENSQMSTMTANSLAICIGPSLLWPVRNSSNGNSNGNNNSSSSNNNLLVGSRKSNDTEDDADGERHNNNSRLDPRINTVSQDAEDVNKVIETLIRHASRIFGDERYNHLSRSFENNSLQVKPFQQGAKDGSTDAESAVSSEPCEDKSHFSSMGTVDDSTDFVSGDEKFGSLEENPERTSYESSAKNEEEGEGEGEEENAARRATDDDRCSGDGDASYFKRRADQGALKREGAALCSSVAPRLIRQRRLVQESFDATSCPERSKADDSEVQPKETISASFANIARKLREDRKKEFDANFETGDDFELKRSGHSLVRKSSSMYDYQQEQGSDSKAEILQRRGMTEKGEDVFPKQILPQKNVSLVDLSEDQQLPRSSDDGGGGVEKNPVRPVRLAGAVTRVSSTDSLRRSLDLDLRRQRSTLWSILGQHRIPNRNVLFGRRLPQKLNCSSSLVGQFGLKAGPIQSIRLPPPSYEEATEYLRKKNLCQQPLFSTDDRPTSGAAKDQNGEKLTVVGDATDKTFDGKKEEKAVEEDDDGHKENIPDSKSKVTKIIVKVVKSPTMLPVSTTTRFIRRKDPAEDETIDESDELHQRLEGTSAEDQQNDGQTTVAGHQRRRRRPKRHSDPRLRTTVRRSHRHVNRSRSDVADTMEKIQERKVSIPDLLKDLKSSLVLKESNANDAVVRAPSKVDGSAPRDSPVIARPQRDRDWRVRLSQHFREIEKNALKEEEEASVAAAAEKVQPEGHPLCIPASIVGDRRQKFERLTTDQVPQRKTEESENTKTTTKASIDVQSSNFRPQEATPSPISSPPSRPHATTQTRIEVPARAATSASYASSAFSLIAGAVGESKLSSSVGFSKTNNFDKLKSIFDTRSVLQEQKRAAAMALASSAATSANAAASSTVDVVPQAVIDLTSPISSSSSSSSRQIFGLGRPVMMNVAIKCAQETTSTTVAVTATATSGSTDVKKESRSDSQSTTWSVARLKKIYAAKSGQGFP